jgi:hypothetical protein
MVVLMGFIECFNGIEWNLMGFNGISLDLMRFNGV